MSEKVVMYGAAVPLADEGGPVKVRRLGDPVIVTGPAPTGQGQDTVYETKIILPGERVELPVDPPTVEGEAAPDAPAAPDASMDAPEAPTGRRGAR